MLNCNCLLSDLWGFPGSSVVKNLPANAGDASSIPGLEDMLEYEMATHSQYSHLENSMDRGASQAMGLRVGHN